MVAINKRTGNTIILRTLWATEKIYDENVLSRNRVTGKFVNTYIDKIGHLEDQVHAYEVLPVTPENMSRGDMMLVDMIRSPKLGTNTFYEDTFVDFIEKPAPVNPEDYIRGDHGHVVIGCARDGEAFLPKYCYKIVASTNRKLSDLGVPTLKAADVIKSFPEYDFTITQVMLKSMGYSVTSDNGQYVVAEKLNENLTKRVLHLNREGNHFAFNDGCTDGFKGNTCFSGRCFSLDEFRIIEKCARMYFD